MQRLNKEAFLKILLELEWFYNMICKVAKKRMLYTTLEFKRCNKFDPCNWEGIKQDEEELYVRLCNEANKAFYDSND